MSNAPSDSNAPNAPIAPTHPLTPSISIVVPVYNESESVARLVDAIGQAMIQ
jgi:cellulose synthase/poly-beta-1,6-N-acetylglucosamine synthase-like glycosyltransferase